MSNSTDPVAAGGGGSAALVFYGVALSAVASTISNLGVNVQKYGFILEAKKPLEDRRPYTRQWRWWCGMAMVVLGAIGDFAAFGMAPQSLATPMGSFTLVANTLFAHYWLKEPMSKRDIIGTAAVVAGAVLAVSFGDHEEPSYTLDQLLRMYLKLSMYIYVCVVATCIAVTYAIIKRAERALKESKDANSDQYRPYKRVHPFAYACLSGMFGAQTCLFAKGTAELLKTTISGNNQLIYPVTYVILLCMLATIFLQTHWLATGLQYFDALYIVPVFQCFFISVSVAGGGVYYGEFRNFSALQAVCFFLGILICVAGVFLLSLRTMTADGFHTVPSDDEADSVQGKSAKEKYVVDSNAAGGAPHRSPSNAARAAAGGSEAVAAPHPKALAPLDISSPQGTIRSVSGGVDEQRPRVPYHRPSLSDPNVVPDPNDVAQRSPARSMARSHRPSILNPELREHCLALHAQGVQGAHPRARTRSHVTHVGVEEGTDTLSASPAPAAAWAAAGDHASPRTDASASHPTLRRRGSMFEGLTELVTELVAAPVARMLTNAGGVAAATQLDELVARTQSVQQLEDRSHAHTHAHTHAPSHAPSHDASSSSQSPAHSVVAHSVVAHSVVAHSVVAHSTVSRGSHGTRTGACVTLGSPPSTGAAFHVPMPFVQEDEEEEEEEDGHVHTGMQVGSAASKSSGSVEADDKLDGDDAV